MLHTYELKRGLFSMFNFTICIVTSKDMLPGVLGCVMFECKVYMCFLLRMTDGIISAFFAPSTIISLIFIQFND